MKNRLISGFKVWLKRDGLVMLLYALVLSVMTYPLVFQLGEIIPLSAPDTYTAMWQNWWMREAIVHGQNLNHTTALFYPNGLDLTLMPRRWTSFPLWLGLFELFGEPTAYNATVLIEVWVKAYAMYLLLMILTQNRFASWIGGAFFAFSARSLTFALQQPNTGAVEFIPIFMLVLLLTLRQLRQKEDLTNRRWLGWVGLLILTFCANVYMNLKIGIFAALIGGIYLLWITFFDQFWRSVRYWQTMILFGIGCLILCAPILMPMLSIDYLESAAFEQFDVADGLDGMSYLKADLKQPFFMNRFLAQFNKKIDISEQPTNGLSQVGFISIILSLIGLLYIIRYERRALIWGIMGILFLFLSFGPEMRVDGQVVSDATLWKLLDLENNQLFVVLRNPFRFTLLLLFQMGILMAYGIHALSQHTLSRHKVIRVLAVLIVAIMLFETSVFPISYRTAKVSDGFKQEFWKTDPGAIVTLPMGRQMVKYDMYTQYWHGQPLQEGMIARMPPGTYAYIKNNPLLNDWQTTYDIEVNRDQWEHSIDQLLTDGYRYLIVYKWVNTGLIYVFVPEDQRMLFFEGTPALYEDEALSIYDLNTVRNYPPPSLREE